MLRLRLDRHYSNIVAKRAITSCVMKAGARSISLPPRALRSTALGWSHLTTPAERVPAPERDTANPFDRAKSPPVVIGRTMGTCVT
jgi:hypothetical protein